MQQELNLHLQQFENNACRLCTVKCEKKSHKTFWCNKWNLCKKQYIFKNHSKTLTAIISLDFISLSLSWYIVIWLMHKFLKMHIQRLDKNGINVYFFIKYSQQPTNRVWAILTNMIKLHTISWAYYFSISSACFQHFFYIEFRRNAERMQTKFRKNIVGLKMGLVIWMQLIF